MDISKEKIDELNAVVKIRLTPEDYKEKVDREIRKHQRNAKVPGFRPGKVPEGMIRKMYGKAILAEELNKLLNDSIYKYLNENKIEILGNPLPKVENNNIDFENPNSFEFLYELGLAPAVNPNLDASSTFDYYQIEVNEELLDKYVSDIRRKYGKFSNPETASAGDILYGEFQELNADGSVKEDGIKNTATLSLDFIKEAERQKFIGKAKDEQVVFNPATAIDNLTELASMLGIKKEEAENIKSDFRYTIQTVNRIEKAELNQEFFDKIYGTGIVNSEAEFFEKVKEDIVNIFRVDADRKLKFDIVEKLLQQTSIQLPDEFLKRWLQAANEKPITPEQISAEYDSYAKGLRWRLIENQIIKEKGIEINPDELKDYTRGFIRSQFAQYGQMNFDDNMVEDMVKRYMSKEEQVRKMYESLADQKVFEWLKSTFTLKNKTLPYDDFIKAVSTL